MTRPTQDELKLARDGQLSAGKPGPTCETCDEPFLPGQKVDVALAHGVRDGRRACWRIYWHDPECRPW